MKTGPKHFLRYFFTSAGLLAGLCFSSFAWAEEIHCAAKGKPTYLFAHGLGGEPKEWDTFAHEVRSHEGYGVWRTQVKKTGHIHERAAKLAALMRKAKGRCGTEPESVIAIGHSMGGLDIRYLVGNRKKYGNEVDLIRSVYTIATPHLGDPSACVAPGGTHDLCGHPKDPGKKSQMREFNKKYPYSDFENNGYKHSRIDFMAFVYECKQKEEGEDGVVLMESQRWDGSNAPHHFRGKGFHKTRPNLTAPFCQIQHGCKPELCQEDEIKHILIEEQNSERKSNMRNTRR